jgi:hypothetical protein
VGAGTQRGVELPVGRVFLRSSARDAHAGRQHDTHHEQDGSSHQGFAKLRLCCKPPAGWLPASDSSC